MMLGAGASFCTVVLGSSHLWIQKPAVCTKLPSSPGYVEVAKNGLGTL